MIDGHIHIEQGDYTIEWIRKFVDRAVETGLDEIRLLEHNYRFEEFASLYGSVCSYSAYNQDWFRRRSAKHRLDEYFELIEKVRAENFPVKVLFGLEICYFREHEELIEKLTKGKGFDFLLGSVHFVDGFAFDHTAELWAGMDVDRVCRRYYEDSVSLAESGLFDGIGHPDAIKLFGHRPSYPLTEYYEQLAEAIARSGIYADQNSGVSRRCSGTGGFGIDPEFLHILKQKQVPFVTSSDAHCPEDVGYRIADLEACILQA